MSKYIGDFAAGDTVDFKFTTFRPSTGATYTLGGTPAISVYKDNSTTQTTSGVTLTADFDSVTGLNHVRITTSSDGTFYADGSQFEVVITTGTVDSVSVVGACVGRFTLRAQSALYPTTAGRKLDVNANGEAGIDWANIGSPSTAVNFSGSTVKAVTDAVTVGTINSNAITAASIAADAGEEIADAVLSRNVSNVENTIATASNFHNLATVVLANLENSISGTTLTIKKTGGSTLTTKTLNVTAASTADVITGVD